MSQTIVHILLPHFPELWVTSGTSEFTIKGSSVFKNIFLSGLNRHLFACRERAVNNTRRSCCGLSLIIIHIIVQWESRTRQKVGIRHFPKMVFACGFRKLLVFGAVFLPTLTKLSFKWFFSFVQEAEFPSYIYNLILFTNFQAKGCLSLGLDENGLNQDSLWDGPYWD